MGKISLLSSYFFVCALLISWSETSVQARNIQVCLPGNTAAFSYLYIAREQGYYAQEQMDLEIMVARGQLCVTALMADQINFTVNPNALDLMVQGKLQGKVIYGAAKGLSHRFMVAPDIKTYRDLKGKKIAISTFGGLTDKLTREILSQHGLEAMKDVFLLQIGTSSVRWAALKSNKVQGALLPGQHGMTAADEGFRELDYESPPHISGPLTTQGETLVRERPMVRSFVRAAMKGHLFFKQRPEETIASIQKVFRIEDRVVAGRLYQDELRRYNPGGQFEEPFLKRVIESIKEERGVKGEVTIKDLFDLSIAEEVAAELKKQDWKP